jgi:hypothetical protein
MMSVDAVQRFVDAGRPVVVSWADGAGSATVLLVDIVDGFAWSKHGMKFWLYEITSVVRADGLSDGRRQWK